MGFPRQRLVPVEKIATDDVRSELRHLEAGVERLRQMIAEPPAVGAQITPIALQRIIKARRARDQYLGRDLFADPAWDILLETYLAELMQTRLSISGLTSSAGVPLTTALRWVHKLEQTGWLSRSEDPTDARRYWVELTPDGSARMAKYFGAISQILPI